MIGAIALIAALVIALSDRLFFAPYLPADLLTYEFSLSYFIGSVLYGGIIEEVLLRLFVMSLLVFIFVKLFERGESANATAESVRTIPSWIYVTAIVTAALLFAAGHLPATAQMMGLSVPIVIRSFALNGLAGLGFGYLYWKHGLGSAIAAHMLTHVLMQLVILPIAG
ncbi:MAG: CPBP family glutamic-type intramembrane protease [Caldilineaceae bacterium]